MKRTPGDDPTGSQDGAAALPNPAGRRHEVRGIAATSLVTTMVVVPMFLLGGMSVLIRADLGFGEAALGVSAASFFAGTSAVSAFGGRVAERVGARHAMLLAAGMSASALLGAALLAQSWLGLTLCMLLAGASNGVGQPASNLALARSVPPGRQGIAFGTKQAAIPLAGLLVGIALPTVGLTVGWRWAFAGAAVGSLLVVVLTPRLPAGHRRPMASARTGDAPIGPLVILAVAAMLGTIAVQTVGTFLVESSVSSGIEPRLAGLLMSLGSVTAIALSIVTGRIADQREGGHLKVVAGMISIGGLGFALLASMTLHPAFAVGGTVLSFGFGWGWYGIFFLAVVRLNPNAPALATGIALTGGATGGVLGPLLFGIVVSQASYPIAWTGSGIVSFAAAILMLTGRRRMLRWREAQGASVDAPPR